MHHQGSALIIGASRGIGLAVVRHLVSARSRVTATWNTTRPNEQAECLSWYQADILQHKQMSALVMALDNQLFDFILINAGIYGPEHQDIHRAEPHEIAALFTVNAVAPVQAASMLMPLLRNNNGVMGIITSRLSSLNENPQAEMPLYSASKAALYMLTRSLQPAAEFKNTTLLSIHPGWVRTDMGGNDAPLDPAESAAGIISMMEQHSQQGGHHFVDYAGRRLTW